MTDFIAVGRENFPMVKAKRPNLLPNEHLLYGQPSAMADSGRRERTYLLWPSNNPVKKADLLEAGFYFTGDEDEVRCFKCDITHKNWQRLDDPSEVHVRKNPHCPFIREKLVGTSSGGGRSVGARRRTTERRRQQPIRDDHDEVESPFLFTSGPGVGEANKNVPDYGIMARAAGRRRRPSPNDALVRKMADYETRVKSYEENWSKDYPVSIEDLSKAGFFYKGPGDRVQCAFCKGIVKNWVPGDSALGEHTRHFPECSHVAQMNREPTRINMLPSVRVLLRMEYKEAEVVDAALRLREKGNSNPTTDDLLDAVFELEAKHLVDSINSTTDGETSNESLTDPISPNEELKNLRREHKRLKDSSLCKVCLDSGVDTLLLPCRHLVCCALCVEKVDICPVCRAQILGTVRIYMS